MSDLLLRLAALPARTVVAVLGALLLLLIVLANVPTVLLAFTKRGSARSDSLCRHVITWTGAVLGHSDTCEAVEHTTTAGPPAVP